MKLKALIVDDERLARNELKRLIEQDDTILEIVGEAVNADDAFQKIENLDPDVIFLDIQMPGKTGFELLQELYYVPDVIFTTAYDEYAIKAFEFNALDYLLKPIDPKRLKEAIQKVHSKKVALEKQALQPIKDTLHENDNFFVKDGDKYFFIKLCDVRYFESAGNYAKVFFGNQHPMVLKSLNALEERLDEKMFFRANRKHIVNIKMIEKVEPSFTNGLLLTLQGGSQIEVSRRQTQRFKELMSL